MDDFNPLVLLIPFIAGFIGWFTNWLAVKATLYPVEFVGIPPLLGWQGVIPKNTEEMSQSFSVLIRDKLVDMEGIFAGIDHDDNEELDKVVEDVAQEIIREFSTNIAPDSWARAREKLREYINMLVRRNVRRVTVEILDRMGKEAGDFIDIDAVVREAMLEDRALLGRVLVQIAGPEFKFIERSGLYFGFLFGVFQMIIWVLYPVAWILPAAGFFVGYLTNWIAIKLVFAPREPVKIGPMTVQGLFHKRQNEVAEAFGRTVATRVLSPDNIVTTVMEGDGATRMNQIVEHRISDLIGKYEAHPMAKLVLPEEKRPALRTELLERIKTEWPKPGGFFHTFAAESVDLQGELERRMKALDRESYEGVLRPAFQQDEWKLIAAGAVLGTVAGVLQLVYIFGDAMERLSR